MKLTQFLNSLLIMMMILMLLLLLLKTSTMMMMSMTTYRLHARMCMIILVHVNIFFICTKKPTHIFVSFCYFAGISIRMYVCLFYVHTCEFNWKIVRSLKANILSYTQLNEHKNCYPFLFVLIFYRY